ncbi:restriction endonuclease subunit S [Thalassorhabdomicrobium marinisediminis]|uniref:Restriction endonuclease n=1 Tax=Thalassorhabdomicrobium marinisediminis TaxID=2170577 RepID=A0A2T7FSW4_9RHOB|nr:restriction endonuclease subunit S [Thalassorhabdomicrobium marinisediminis]PVA05245.1 restriction endonuclease [Thalassorhabdomicrobium marinisediminis]
MTDVPQVTKPDEWTPVAPVVPDSWAEASFDEVFSVISTSEKKIPQKLYLKKGKWPVIDQGASFVGGYTDDENTIIYVDEPLLVFGDHTRCFKFVRNDFAPGADGIKILAASPLLLPKFYYYLYSAIKLPNRGYSRHFGFLKRCIFPIAPLNEQRRIVDKIEAMFERIDKGVENLQAARAALGLYRQSLLKSAFEGRLTADWRAANADKLEDPKTLLARIQTERDARYKAALDDWQTALEAWRNGGEEGKKPAKPKRPRDIPVSSINLGLNGWAKIPLGLMIETPSYGTSKKCDYDGGAYGVLRIPNIGAGRIDATDLKKADFNDNEAEQYSLIEGDILTVRSNGSLSIVGKPALVTAQDTGNLFAGYLIRLRAISNSLRPQYLAHIMAEPHIRGQIEAKAKSTSGVNNISAKELQDLNIPICSPAEQSEITRILDERLSAADTMEAEIDAALTRADALRQSILKQAFSGKLAPQDPDDEPAAALLARIKAEREAAPKPKRKKRGAA